MLLTRRDRAALAAAVDRAADPGFLLDRVADDFAERVSLMKRTFARGLSVEAYDGRVSRRLRAACVNVGAIVDAEPSAVLRAQCASGALAAGHTDQLGENRDRHINQASDGFDLDKDVGVGLINVSVPIFPIYDLVVSGLSLQLVDDLPGALVLMRQAMKPDGLLLAALLGGDTLHELRTAWLVAEEESTGGASPRVAPFADVRALGGLLQRAGFALPVADSDRVTVTYETPLHLMRELKSMGAGNMLVDRRRVPVTRSLLMRAATVYAERFGMPDGRVPATFEIVTLTAWVPHASQQKPLAPGSATARLADVLGRDTDRRRQDGS